MPAMGYPCPSPAVLFLWAQREGGEKGPGGWRRKILLRCAMPRTIFRAPLWKSSLLRRRRDPRPTGRILPGSPRGRQKKRPLMRPFLHMGPMLRAGVGISVHGAAKRAIWTIVSPGIPLALSLPALPAEKIEVRKFLLTSAPGINVSRVGVQTYCRCGKTVFRS